MAMEYDVQRLVLGDVVLVDLDGEPEPVEGKVVREIDRTRHDRPRFVASGRARGLRQGVALSGHRVTVVRGP